MLLMNLKTLLYIRSKIKTHPENLFLFLVYPPAIIINLITVFDSISQINILELEYERNEENYLGT